MIEDVKNQQLLAKIEEAKLLIKQMENTCLQLEEAIKFRLKPNFEMVKPEE